MTPNDVLQYCFDNFKETVSVNSRRKKRSVFNPDNIPKRGVYVLTVKEKDGESDKSSQLDGKGIFRISLGVRKNIFVKLFGAVPKRTEKGGAADMDCDFTVTGRLLPHPVYVWAWSVC